MTFNAVNRVNFLSNNKWQTPATIGLCFPTLCVIFMHLKGVFARFPSFLVLYMLMTDVSAMSGLKSVEQTYVLQGLTFSG